MIPAHFLPEVMILNKSGKFFGFGFADGPRTNNTPGWPLLASHDVAALAPVSMALLNHLLS